MGNDDLFARISSGGKCLKLVCDNTNNAIAITTFQSRQFIYWNKRMEHLFGQGFHRRTWSELSSDSEELKKDIAMCEDLINNVTPEDYFFIEKHYTNYLTGEVWYAACEFYHIGQTEIDGQLQDIFLFITRKIEQAMDPDTVADKAIKELKRRSKKPAIYAGVATLAAFLSAVATLLAEINDLKRDTKVTPDEVLHALQAYVNQTAGSSTNSFE